jgi:hypothetical protein
MTEGIKCPKCGAPEIDWCGAETHYKCGSADYDQRPGTFKQSIQCAKAEARAEALREAGCAIDSDFKAYTRSIEKQGIREDRPDIASFLDGHRQAQVILLDMLEKSIAAIAQEEPCQ